MNIITILLLQLDFGWRFCICVTAWKIHYEKWQKGKFGTYKGVNSFARTDLFIRMLTTQFTK